MGRGPSRESKDLMDLIYEVFQREHPMGPRRVAYAIYGNRAGSMAAKVGKLCGRMLDEGRLPLHWYDDSSRSYVEPFVAEDLNHVALIGRQAPPLDPWADQPVVVKCWSEKSVGDTLAPVLERYSVPFLNTRGWNARKILMEEARRAETDPRRLVIVYCGDHDASGLRMSEVDLPNRLGKYGAVDYELRRVAIVAEDFAAMKAKGLVDKIKPGDPNRKWYVEHTGETVGVELEALPAPDLRQRVEDAIRDAVADPAAWKRSIEASKAICDSWQEWVDLWPGPSIRHRDHGYDEVTP